MKSYFYVLGCRLIFKDDFWENLYCILKVKYNNFSFDFEQNFLLLDKGDLVVFKEF